MRAAVVGLIAVLGLTGAGVARAEKAKVAQTGQEVSYAAGDDGAQQVGVELPAPRFKDKGDGTIKDNLTGLVWLKNANCPNTTRQWSTALSDVASLNSSGTMNGLDCGDRSGKQGSYRTDWRLPNVRELQSLLDFAFSGPAVANTAGTGQATNGNPFANFGFFGSFTYWSSTTKAGDPDSAWPVDLGSGEVRLFGKSLFFLVTAVRGGD